MPDPASPVPAPTDAAREVFRLFSTNKHEEALELAEKFIAAPSQDPFLFNVAGASAVRAGKAALAEVYFKSALRLWPDFDQAYFGLAVLYGTQSRFAEAEACYLKVLALKLGAAEAWCNLGTLYVNMKRFEDAERAFRKAIELRPNYPIAYNNYGRLMADLHHYEEAEKYYRQALSLDPNLADALYNYAHLLAARRRFGEAEAAFRRVIAVNPGYIDAYAGLGNLLKDMNRWGEAEACYRKVLDMRAEDADVYATLGALCVKLKRFTEAETYFRHALALDPDHPKSMMNFSFLLLLQARFEEGWPLYEARYRYDVWLNKNILYTPDLPFPQWRGEALAGKKLLIWHEQGYGDIIQSVRYVAILKQQGVKHITLVCKRALIELMRTLDGIDDILCYEDQPVPAPHDYWTFPFSIPLYCKTRLETIPSRTNYISVPQSYRDKWRGRIRSDLMKVGIVWKGSAGHIDDPERSLPNLEKLRSLWAVRGIDFISLQKGEGAAQAAHPPHDQELIDLGPRIEDFADTAAIIEQLDLVICVDTAVAHLAGALGKPVWVLTRHVPDWRWLMDREDSPWYPTMHLFRQPQRDNWGTVVEHIRLALQKEAERYWSRAVEQKPKDLFAQFYYGCLLQSARRMDEAEACFRKVLEFNPGNPTVYGQLGNLMKEAGRLPEAEQFYRQTLKATPDSFVAHNNLGTLLKMQDRIVEAEFHYRESLRLKPDFTDAHNNLGNIYLVQERFEESEACFLRALELNPFYMDGYNNLGLLYKEIRNFAKAEECYRKALALEPGNPKTMFMLSLVLLVQGRFGEGWIMFETPHRYDQSIDRPVPIAPFLPFTPWRGQPLAGKSLVLWYEQGFGDVIQFVRYIPLLKQQGAGRITLVCKPPQKRLLETLENVDRVLSLDEKDLLEPHDYWAFLMSCPLYCRTVLETIPSHTGYISAPAVARRKWQGILSASKGFKIGLVWKGSTDHKRDAERSLSSLSMLRPLWDVQGISFVSLQKGRGEDEAAKPPKGQKLMSLGDKIDDFADTAAILEQLDLVICVDTAIAHLAGALGKPVWLLVPYTPDWRWLLDREDSPWYPTMRLFRQNKRGDWNEVIQRIKTELGRFAQKAK